MLERNNLIALFALDLLVIAAGQLDGRLICLGTAVAEEGKVRTAYFGQQTSCCLLLRNLEEVGYMPQLIQLVLDLILDLLRRMAEIGDRNTAEKIQIAVALIIPEPAPLPFYQRNRKSRPIVRKQRAYRLAAIVLGLLFLVISVPQFLQIGFCHRFRCLL
ncbi:hypothetical protein D3C72_1069240 [compost metagenome]